VSSKNSSWLIRAKADRLARAGQGVRGMDSEAEDESKMAIGTGSIQQVVTQIVQEFHPERVILFGSYASGTPTPESDVDLLVVMPCEGKETRKAIEILHTIAPKIPIDLLKIFVKITENLFSISSVNLFHFKCHFTGPRCNGVAYVSGGTR
jgi:predicted nucleotidyltransferase